MPEIAGRPTSAERSRRLRERKATGVILVSIEVARETIAAAQRLSGRQQPLTADEVGEQMIAALHACLDAAAKTATPQVHQLVRGRGTWDDPLLSVRKPLVWS